MARGMSTNLFVTYYINNVTGLEYKGLNECHDTSWFDNTTNTTRVGTCDVDWDECVRLCLEPDQPEIAGGEHCMAIEISEYKCENHFEVPLSISENIDGHIGCFMRVMPPPSAPPSPPLPLPPTPPPPSPPPPAVQQSVAAGGTGLQDALDYALNDASGLPVEIVLAPGVHTLSRTIQMGPGTVASKLTISAQGGRPGGGEVVIQLNDTSARFPVSPPPPMAPPPPPQPMSPDEQGDAGSGDELGSGSGDELGSGSGEELASGDGSGDASPGGRRLQIDSCAAEPGCPPDNEKGPCPAGCEPDTVPESSPPPLPGSPPASPPPPSPPTAPPPWLDAFPERQPWLELNVGAPPVYLSGLTIVSPTVIVEGEHPEGFVLVMTACKLTNASGAGGTTRALQVFGGVAYVFKSYLVDNPGGAVHVAGSGLVSLATTIVSGNAAEMGAAALVQLGGELQAIDTEMFENTATKSGGALAITIGGVAVLSNRTLMRNNVAPVGASISLADGATLSYTLPSPLGRWLFIASGDTYSQVPGSAVDQDFPFACSPGVLGSSYALASQSGPACHEVCPAGSFCGSASVESIECAAGTFCPTGSPSETACPAGTYGAQPGLVAESDCTPCTVGHACPKGSAAPEPCSPGSVAPDMSMAACNACEAGSYQDEEGASACKECPEASFCIEGAFTPALCFAGTWSGELGLVSSDECMDCPLGSWCGRGSDSPQPCPDGTFGTQERLSAAEFCTACEAPTTSTGTGLSCDLCAGEYYAVVASDANASASAPVTCVICPDGAYCSELNTTLATVDVRSSYWRLSAASDTVYTCAQPSSCVGGKSAGERGEGYCAPGHQGALCEVCTTKQGEEYYSKKDGRCIDCPSTGTFVGATIGAVLGAAMLVAFANWFVRLDRPEIEQLRRLVWRAIVAMKRAGTMPRLKLLVDFYQCFSALTPIYAVTFPRSAEKYIEWTEVFVFDIDQIIPSSCMLGGYFRRLIFRGVLPLIGCFIVFVLACTYQAVQGAVKKKLKHAKIIIDELSRSASGDADRPKSPAKRKPPTLQQIKQSSNADMLSSTGSALVAFHQKPVWLRGLLMSIPAQLFILFCMTPGVSAAIFASWSCVEYEEDSAAGTRVSYLRTDVRVRCTGDGYTSDEHEDIKALAAVLLVLWPVGIPLLFLALLRAVRKVIAAHTMSPLSLATNFLHSEYQVHAFWFEPVTLLRRLIITGFVVVLTNDDSTFLRIVIALILMISYIVALLVLQPFRRDDLTYLAVFLQFVLIISFFGGMVVKLFNDTVVASSVDVAYETLGVRDEETIVVLMAVLLALATALFAVLVTYRVWQATDMPILKVMGRTPRVVLRPGKSYHLFLSHVWASGQDQAATLKRQLCLLLPGANIFLDVDDLQSIEALEKYVDDSQCILIFLSKGYFFSANCIRELKQSWRRKKELCPVHEVTASHGGEPLERLAEQCPEQYRDWLFEEHSRRIVPWHRIKDFQLVTLKLIAASMLHAMPDATRDHLALDRNSTMDSDPKEARSSSSKEPLTIDDISIPGEISKAEFRFAGVPWVYCLPRTEQSTGVLNEVIARCGLKELDLPSVASKGKTSTASLRRGSQTRSTGAEDAEGGHLEEGKGSRMSARKMSTFRIPMRKFSSVISLASGPLGAPAAAADPGPSQRDHDHVTVTVPVAGSIAAPEGSDDSTSGAASVPPSGRLSTTSGVDTALTLARAASTLKNQSPQHRRGSILTSQFAQKRSSSISNSSKGNKQGGFGFMRCDSLDDATHCMLYLNASTFLHDGIMEDLEEALERNITMVLVHENDLARGGVPEFGTFFQQAPRELIENGLFKSLAIALHRDPYRRVSLSLAAKAFGGVRE